MNRGNFHGLETVVLENKFFRLECLTEAGPRVVRFIPQWVGENLFAELPRHSMPTPYGEYRFFGGHRLWTAPESAGLSHVPDSAGVEVKEVQSGARLTGPVDAVNGLRKTITLQMSSSEPGVIVKHKIENIGASPIRLAPWGITMMRPKGVAILPQQTGNLDGDGLLPNRRFALWPYSRWDDSRLKLKDDLITVNANSTPNPFKVGYFNPHGWLGYVYDDVMFVKRFGVRRDEEYPDFGCNNEIYTDARSLELETLAPLTDLAPDSEVAHTETWNVHNLDALPADLLDRKTIEDILAR